MYNRFTPSVYLTPPIFLISFLRDILHKQPIGVSKMPMATGSIGSTGKATWGLGQALEVAGLGD